MDEPVETRYHNATGSTVMPSLPEVHGTVGIPTGVSFWRKVLAFSGPGFLVAVGYMDPGNWATDIAGGSQFAYRLIFVLFMSNLMAILVQALAARLGIVTQLDLAQACRGYYSRRTSLFLWVLCEIAIAACDLAEVIGSAIALNLLFHIPLLIGVCLTALDVLAILYLQHKGFRYLEALVVALIGTIGVCYLVEILLVKPDLSRNRERLYSNSGAFDQPGDALYCHRDVGRNGDAPQPLPPFLAGPDAGDRADQGGNTRPRCDLTCLDYVVALNFAFFINAAILIMAAGTFYRHGLNQVAEIQDAYHTLAPLLGTQMASILFAIALLCSGQNSTLTGTLAGQIVMEGFLNLRLAPWLRRLITRLMAIIPAIIAVAFFGTKWYG